MNYKVVQGDCVEVMKLCKAESVDAVVCDPPYGLEFMGKDFDDLTGKWKHFDSIPAEWIRDYEDPD